MWRLENARMGQRKRQREKGRCIERGGRDWSSQLTVAGVARAKSAKLVSRLKLYKVFQAHSPVTKGGGSDGVADDAAKSYEWLWIMHTHTNIHRKLSLSRVRQRHM